LARQSDTGIKRVVGRVKAKEDLPGSKAAGLLDDPLKKRNESVLAVPIGRRQSGIHGGHGNAVLYFYIADLDLFKQGIEAHAFVSLKVWTWADPRL